jgi:hypothetical protein
MGRNEAEIGPNLYNFWSTPLEVFHRLPPEFPQGKQSGCSPPIYLSGDANFRYVSYFRNNLLLEKQAKFGQTPDTFIL